jgi:hypothetical protein
MAQFYHRQLPDHTTLLSGHSPPDKTGLQSGQLPIWYNNGDAGWPPPQEPLQFSYGRF